MAESATLTVVIFAFLLAGTAKGIVGFGIQVVALAILTIAIDLLTAMAILLAPAIATNIWQSMVGGLAVALIRRLWPFLLAVAALVFVGALALTRVEISWLTGLLGIVTIAYAISGLAGIRFEIRAGAETWLGPLFGAANGMIMGMTGCSVVPGTMYLQSLKLPRDMLVQAMGMLYMVAAVALAAAMQLHGLLNLELGYYSLVAVVPALLGMWLGQGIRRRLPELIFQRIFFSALLALGTYVLAAAA